MGRTFMNEYSRVEQTAQYVDFQITINPHRYAQGFGKVIADDPVNLILRVRYGAHEGVQEMINMIGAAAGLGPPFRQVLDRLLVHLVVVEGHAEQAEMGRFLELAPEILDEVFEYARVLVEFQE